MKGIKGSTDEGGKRSPMTNVGTTSRGENNKANCLYIERILTNIKDFA